MEKAAKDAPRGELLVANERRHCCGAHGAPHRLWRVACIYYSLEERIRLRASALASALAIALATHIRWQRGVCALVATASSLALALAIALVGCGPAYIASRKQTLTNGIGICIRCLIIPSRLNFRHELMRDVLTRSLHNSALRAGRPLATHIWESSPLSMLALHAFQIQITCLMRWS